VYSICYVETQRSFSKSFVTNLHSWYRRLIVSSAIQDLWLQDVSQAEVEEAVVDAVMVVMVEVVTVSPLAKMLSKLIALNHGNFLGTCN